jgi:hypothetical protein
LFLLILSRLELSIRQSFRFSFRLFFGMNYVSGS